MFTRMMAALVLAIPVFLWQGGHPVFGQEAMDVEQIEDCLTTTSESGTGQLATCVDKLSAACSTAEGPASVADCMLREAKAWNAIADRRLADLVSKSKPDVAESVRLAQANWERFREAHCDATGIFFDQYSGSASAEWQARCLRDSAAERALLLDDWLIRSEDFE